MTRLKDATFEAGTLTGTDAFTSTTGSPTVDTTSKIKGANSIDFNWSGANEFGTVSGLSANELFGYFYIRVITRPGSDVRILNTSNGSSQMSIALSSTGTLKFRNNTTVLFTSAALTNDVIYRVGFHQKVSTAIGNADSIIEGWVVAGDAAFDGTNLVGSTSNNLMNTSAANFTSVTAGNTNATNSGQFYLDNLRIDNATMPTDDVGGNNTPKDVTVTSTVTVTSPQKTIGKLISVVSNAVESVTRFFGYTKTITISSPVIASFAKGLVNLKTITVTVGKSISIVKNIGKPITKAVTTVVIRNINMPKVVLTSLVEIITANKNIGKFFTGISNVIASANRLSYKVANVVTNTSSVIQKNILKPIFVIQSITVIITKAFTLTVSIISNTAIFISKLTGMELLFAQINRNARNITLNMKDTTLGILGINKRTITLKDKEDDNS